MQARWIPLTEPPGLDLMQTGLGLSLKQTRGFGWTSYRPRVPGLDELQTRWTLPTRATAGQSSPGELVLGPEIRPDAAGGELGFLGWIMDRREETGSGGVTGHLGCLTYSSSTWLDEVKKWASFWRVTSSPPGCLRWRGRSPWLQQLQDVHGS